LTIHPIRSRWFRVAAIVGVAISAGGWFQAPTAPEIPPPTIRVNTRLVLVDVVATDKQGKPVTGLTRNDFTVEENGKPQKISTFETPGEGKLPGAPALPPGIYSNRAQYRSPGGPITVLLLDALNTPFKDQAYARRQMLRFVQEQYKPGQRMAIFTLTDGLRVLQDFTSDPQTLYTALQHYLPEPQRLVASGGPTTTTTSGTATAGSTVTALDASVAPKTVTGGDAGPRGMSIVSANMEAMQSALQAFESASTAYQLDQRTVITLDALNSMARILGGLPGRKNIIWVTGDLPFSLIPENRTVTQAELEEDLPSLNTRRVGEHSAGNYAATARESNAEQIRETSTRLSTAQVAIYPVDARGLSISVDTDSQEIMREMARETGGRAYVNQNEIREGVARAFEDESATYTVGYYPENKKWDGKYRQIKVKVKRDGVELQNRRGYYAIDPTKVKGYNPETEVKSALNDAAPATLVAFTARLVPPSANAAKGKMGVDFLVDAGTLSAEDASGGKRLNVVFYTYAFSPAGKTIGFHSTKVDQTFDQNTYQQIVQKGLLTHMDLDAVPSGSQVRLAVQDARTGMVGSLEAPAP
jgi:VWFA-related protein